MCTTDIDECQKNHNGGCDHICINTNGSYYCTCHDGYVLTKDNSSCAGMKLHYIITAASYSFLY